MNPQHVKWSTHSENCKRRTEHGTQTIGERHGMAKLTKDDVEEIRNTPFLYGSGVKLARKYGVSPGAISLIRTGKNWKHL